MAGHSKWETTKRKKAAIDAKRGKQFARLVGLGGGLRLYDHFFLSQTSYAQAAVRMFAARTDSSGRAAAAA